VSDHDFFLALGLPHDVLFDSMLDAVAAAVLRHFGCEPEDVDSVTRAVRRALAARPHEGEQCDVRFRAHGATLEITVSFAGGATWDTACSLPSRS
jgi:hypothetical protein